MSDFVAGPCPLCSRPLQHRSTAVMRPSQSSSQTRPALLSASSPSTVTQRMRTTESVHRKGTISFTSQPKLFVLDLYTVLFITFRQDLHLKSTNYAFRWISYPHENQILQNLSQQCETGFGTSWFYCGWNYMVHHTRNLIQYLSKYFDTCGWLGQNIYY